MECRGGFGTMTPVCHNLSTELSRWSAARPPRRGDVTLGSQISAQSAPPPPLQPLRSVRGADAQKAEPTDAWGEGLGCSIRRGHVGNRRRAHEASLNARAQRCEQVDWSEQRAWREHAHTDTLSWTLPGLYVTERDANKEKMFNTFNLMEENINIWKIILLKENCTL